MARLKANFSIDMTDLTSSIGRAVFYDEDTLVIRVGPTDTYYLGDFSYPDGEWKGTIEAVSVYYRGTEVWSVHGIELSTKFATAGADTEAAYRKALARADVMLGSHEADALVGYAGNDRLNGSGGDDLLAGGNGGDLLLGSGGDDALKGQEGRDVLTGGRGDDRLAGGDGADRFVFGGADGSDEIVDFGGRLEKIVIESGAHRFDQLEIAKDGDDVLIAFDDTLITVRDVFLRSIGPEDFVF